MYLVESNDSNGGSLNNDATRHIYVYITYIKKTYRKGTPMTTKYRDVVSLMEDMSL